VKQRVTRIDTQNGRAKRFQCAHTLIETKIFCVWHLGADEHVIESTTFRAKPCEQRFYLVVYAVLLRVHLCFLNDR
tara:strand:- start:144591 stop:144818 length:228 start_codon:yes stop_codon:yes gene_type:complete